MDHPADTILDQLLVIEAGAGDQEAWRVLIERWHPLLIRRAIRLTGDPHAAADAAQETWLSVARGLRGLRDPARFAPWIYRILARRCADRVSRDVRRPDRTADVSGVAGPEPDDTDQQRRLQDAIGGLSGEQRLLLSMRYADGVPIRVIAEILGIAQGTVKSRLFTAREVLRHALGSEMNEPKE